MSEFTYEEIDEEHIARSERIVIDRQELLINKASLEAEREALNAKIAKIDNVLALMKAK